MIHTAQLSPSILLVLLFAVNAHAARLVHLEVELDGELVLNGIATDSGTEKPGFVWLYFHSTELEPVGEFTVSEPSGRPLKSTVEGNITTRARHVDEVLAEASTKSLILRPFPNGTPGTWQVAPVEVERTATLAGLPLPQGEAMTGPGVAIGRALDAPLILLSFVGFVLLVLIVTVGAIFFFARQVRD